MLPASSAPSTPLRPARPRPSTSPQFRPLPAPSIVPTARPIPPAGTLPPTIECPQGGGGTAADSVTSRSSWACDHPPLVSVQRVARLQRQLAAYAHHLHAASNRVNVHQAH